MTKRWRRRGIYLVLPAVLWLAGCGPGEEAKDAAPASEAAPAAEARPKAADPALSGTIRGRVLFKGEVPPAESLPIQGNPECSVFHRGGDVRSEALLVKDGYLRNAFVYVEKGLEGREFSPPSEPVVIANTRCVYVPHVAGAQVGQEVTLLNNDATLHNIHTYAKNQKSWNLGLPFEGMRVKKKFLKPEVMITMKCDLHPWMIGYVGVLPHPYFDVTEEEGNFTLEGLPPGDYTVTVWHETLGTQSRDVRLEAKAVQTLEFVWPSA